MYQLQQLHCFYERQYVDAVPAGCCYHRYHYQTTPTLRGAVTVLAGVPAERGDDDWLAVVSTALCPGSVMTAAYSTHITYLLNLNMLPLTGGIMLSRVCWLVS